MTPKKYPTSMKRPIEHHTQINGSDVYFWEYNPDKKQTIVVVHGFRGTHHGLESIIKELPEYRFIVPDLPGFGKSTPMVSAPHTIDGYADCIYKLIPHSKSDQIFLLGHSMGSVIVAKLISDYPHLTTKAVFINPISAKPSEGIGRVKLFPGVLYHQLAGKILPEKIGLHILKNKQLFLLGSASMTMTRDKALRKIIHWNHVTYMKEFSDRKTLLEAFESSAISTIADYKDSITIPTLFIAGTRDAIAPIKSQRTLTGKMAQAMLVEIENVGHIIHYEKPRLAAKAIKNFIQ
jgi:pimeloyl-ACP methyl ester carboxylesterase